MPLYFFHLSFGNRLLRDDEGTELRSRSAARDEALTVVRDLSDRIVGAGRKRWAGWFLLVADERGDFLRLPIGHPALHVVPAPPLHFQTAARERGVRERCSKGTAAAMGREILARQQHTSQLLAHNRRLRDQLSAEFLALERMRLHLHRLLAHARVLNASMRERDFCCVATRSD